MTANPPRSLQHRIEGHLRDWSVQAEHTTETETSILVFGQRLGEPVVLKVLRRPGDEWRSGAVLAAFDGQAVVRVYEYSDGALLVSLAVPCLWVACRLGVLA